MKAYVNAIPRSDMFFRFNPLIPLHNMKKFSTFILLSLCIISLSAKDKVSKPLKKAHATTCSVMTYDSDGNLITSGQGVFLGDKGELLASYEMFRHAATAVTIDADGVTRPVLKLKGANELYNVVRVNVATDKKLKSLPIDSVRVTKGERLYMTPVSTTKKGVGRWLTVDTAIVVSERYAYYTLSGEPAQSDLSGRPLLTEDGQLAAIVQPSAEGDSIFYALDARFGADLDIKALTLNEPSYRNLDFPKALPEDLEQAQVYLFVTSNQNDTAYYAKVVNAFIDQFPNSFDGYIRRAGVHIAKGDEAHFALAEADQEKALELAENKDEIYYQISRQMLTAMQADTTLKYKDWSLDRAAEILQQAIDIKPQTAYWQQMGDIRYVQGNADGAFQAYEAICHLPEANAENFYNAAIACEQLPDSLEHAIALMDSAVVRSSQGNNLSASGLSYESAPFVLERAMMKARNNIYRGAVADFNLYEQLAGTSANDRFYYLREQAEANARMYQQALDDIDTAISINPIAAYLLEKASLSIRVNHIDEAMHILENLIAAFPDDLDCNRLLGYCYATKGNIAKARPLLEHASSLGDANAASLIERYCK